jgi:hypothetical protein
VVNRLAIVVGGQRPGWLQEAIRTFLLCSEHVFPLDVRVAFVFADITDFSEDKWPEVVLEQ